MEENDFVRNILNDFYAFEIYAKYRTFRLNYEEKLKDD